MQEKIASCTRALGREHLAQRSAGMVRGRTIPAPKLQRRIRRHAGRKSVYADIASPPCYERDEAPNGGSKGGILRR